MEKRENIYPEEGLHKYGNVLFADPINKKYPINTPEHIRAAWRYIHMPRDYDKYDTQDRELIENRIIKAWKKQISPEGPPSENNDFID